MWTRRLVASRRERRSRARRTSLFGNAGRDARQPRRLQVCAPLPLALRTRQSGCGVFPPAPSLTKSSSHAAILSRLPGFVSFGFTGMPMPKRISMSSKFWDLAELSPSPNAPHKRPHSPACRAVWTVGRTASANSSADISLFRLHCSAAPVIAQLTMVAFSSGDLAL
jgi:hypothetical protein